mgnify:CR=1 FL=1
MNVYLVRHGETSANSKDIFIDDDDPLTEKGREQASFLADRMTRIAIDSLFSSDIPRAQETAEIIAKKINKKPEYTVLFRERREPSSLKGLSFHDPKVSEVRKERDQRLEDPSWHYEDEENFYETLVRSEQALAFLLEHRAPHVAVVTHGMFKRFLVGVAVFGDAFTPDVWRKLRFGVYTSNTGITVLRYGAKPVAREWSLLTWNDHAHLG